MKGTRIIFPVFITILCLLYSCSGSKFRHLNKVSADVKSKYEGKSINAKRIYITKLNNTTETPTNTAILNTKEFAPNHKKHAQRKHKFVQKNDVSYSSITLSDTIIQAFETNTQPDPVPQKKKNSAATVTLISFLLGLLAVITGSALYVGLFFSLSIVFGVIAFVNYFKDNQWLMLIIPITLLTYAILGLLLYFSI
jgi:hypothetical protein